MEVGPGDYVLMPGYTCMVIPSAVVFAGGKPIYADVEEESYNVTLKTLKKALSRHAGPRPRAIIIQHTYGIPVEAMPIIEWAEAEGMAVIEDCAHVLGTCYNGTPCGRLGDAAFFSSQWTKPVTTGIGGWAVANNPTVATRLEQIHASFRAPPLPDVFLLALQFFIHRILFTPQLYWALMGLYRFLGSLGLVIGSSHNKELALEMPDRYEMRMSLFQLKMLERAFGQIEEVIAHRRGIALLYKKRLSKAGYDIPKHSENSEPVFLRYPLSVPRKKEKLAWARANRTELGDWFVSPVHPLVAEWEKLGYQRGCCPVAEELCQTVVNLPTHTRISETEALRICELAIA